MLNYMLYFRGNPEDFNEWEKLGNSGWGWKDVLPFFKKAERFAGPNSNDSYGTKGRLDVMPNTYIHKVILTFNMSLTLGTLMNNAVL